MFAWKKVGNVFNPTVIKSRPWMQEFAQVPFPFVIDENILRVYFSCRGQRDPSNRYISYPAYVDLYRHDLTKIVGVAERPVMQLGSPGAFDEFGITSNSLVQRADKIYLYYGGWTRMQSVPYTIAIGMAISHDAGKSFTRLGEGPIIGPTLKEPYLLSGPIVKVIESQWHMWYLTGRKWLFHNGKYEAVYQIAHATSGDGISWDRNGVPVIPTLSVDECQAGFALFYRGTKWHAIFSFRPAIGFREGGATSYRLGYASSSDLTTWVRDDSHVGIDVSPCGWDSQMMCYPQIGEIDNRVLLFYCGNDFGREGFGIAELIDPKTDAT